MPRRIVCFINRTELRLHLSFITDFHVDRSEALGELQMALPAFKRTTEARNKNTCTVLLPGNIKRSIKPGCQGLIFDSLLSLTTGSRFFNCNWNKTTNIVQNLKSLLYENWKYLWSCRECIYMKSKTSLWSIPLRNFWLSISQKTRMQIRYLSNYKNKLYHKKIKSY